MKVAQKLHYIARIKHEKTKRFDSCAAVVISGSYEYLISNVGYKKPLWLGADLLCCASGQVCMAMHVHTHVTASPCLPSSADVD